MPLLVLFFCSFVLHSASCLCMENKSHTENLKTESFVKKNSIHGAITPPPPFIENEEVRKYVVLINKDKEKLQKDKEKLQYDVTWWRRATITSGLTAGLFLTIIIICSIKDMNDDKPTKKSAIDGYGKTGNSWWGFGGFFTK